MSNIYEMALRLSTSGNHIEGSAMHTLATEVIRMTEEKQDLKEYVLSDIEYTNRILSSFEQPKGESKVSYHQRGKLEYARLVYRYLERGGLHD